MAAPAAIAAVESRPQPRPYSGEPMRLGDVANDGAQSVRQAARRRARARGRADAGAAVRHAAARPARRRRREGRASRARRVGPRRRRRRCSIPRAARSARRYLRNNLNKRSIGIDLKAPEGRELFLALGAALRRDRRELQGRHDGSHGPRLRRRSRPRIPRAIYVSISGFGNTVDDAVPRLARVRVDRRGDVGHLRLQARPDEPPVHDPGRRARRHQLRAVRRHRRARRAAPPRPHRRRASTSTSRCSTRWSR